MNTDRTRGAAQATAGMLLVGGLVAVSSLLGDYPVYGGQAVRYALGAAVLFAVLAVRRPPPVRPTPRQWALLGALACTGLAAFNVCIVLGTAYASPATIGTVIGAAPVVIAVLGPVLAGRRPAARVAAGAVVVVAGTAVATGLGGASTPGVLLGAGALACEVAFSLLAVPLLPVLGALRVSAYTSAIAVPLLLGAGLVRDGADVLRVPTAAEAGALAYLGLAATAAAFLLWYDALPRLGADRAGLFCGVMPIGAVATMVLLGMGMPSPGELAGAGLVVAGIALGMRTKRAKASAAAPEPVAVS